MIKKTVGIILFGILNADAVAAGPLTNAFLESLENYGEASWSEGYIEGRRETLTDVVIRMRNGQRYDISRVTLGFEDQAFTLDAEDFRMNPEGDVHLLKADRFHLNGDIRLLETVWSQSLLSDACVLSGPQTKIQIDNFGLILAGGDDFLDEDSKYRADSLSILAKTSGTEENCRVKYSLAVDYYEAFLSDGTSDAFTSLEIDAEIPGNLQSLSKDPGQDVLISAAVTNMSSLISGGATAWAVKDGNVEAQAEALGLVPALTYTLKNRTGEYGVEYWMRIWNSLRRFEGKLSGSFSDVTMRTSNVLPPEYVTKFKDAGLTTLLLDLEGEITASDQKISLNADMKTTGVMDAALQADLRFGSYSEETIELQSVNPLKFDRILPVYVDHLHYAHTDDGLIDSAANIMGVPVTVRINQIRESKANESPEISSVVRRIATDAANFAALSYRDPPARLDLSIGEGLNLREALIVSGKVPQDIFEIFSISVGSGPEKGE